MNYGELRDAFYRWTRQSNAKGYLNDTDVEQMIHEGHMKLFQIIAEHFEGHFKRQATISETQGQGSYAFPNADIYKIKSLERVKDPNGVSQAVPYFMHLVQDNIWDVQDERTTIPSQTYQNRYPDSYVLNGLESFSLLIASGSTIADSIRVTYIARPARMTATSSVPFQVGTEGTGGAGTPDFSEMHDLIYLYAVEAAFGIEGNYKQMQAVQARRVEREGEAKMYLDRSQIQQPRFVIHTDEEEFYLA